MRVLLIDAMNLIRRMYAGMPDHENKIQACVSKCVDVVSSIANRVDATHCAVVFEDKEPTWRHQLWQDYKKGRQPMPEELQPAIRQFWKGFTESGVKCLFKSAWEADDIIATIAHKVAERQGNVTIVSTDKGFYQLVNFHIQVLNYFDRKLYGAEEVFQRYGVHAHQLVDLIAITGDSTNHLPGIKGIGIKTATELLKQYEDLDGIYLAKDQLTSRQQKLIDEGWQNAALTRKLARLKVDMDVGANLSQIRYGIGQ